MERFAKIFETPTTQVLVYLSTDPEKNNPKVFRILSLEGMEFSANLCWDTDDEKSWDAAQKAFDNQTQETAEQLVTQAKELWENPNGDVGTIINKMIRA